MRNHFLTTEVGKLATQYHGLNSQYFEKKTRLERVKAEQTRLREVFSIFKMSGFI